MNNCHIIQTKNMCIHIRMYSIYFHCHRNFCAQRSRRRIIENLLCQHHRKSHRNDVIVLAFDVLSGGAGGNKRPKLQCLSSHCALRVFCCAALLLMQQLSLLLLWVSGSTTHRLWLRRRSCRWLADATADLTLRPKTSRHTRRENTYPTKTTSEIVSTTAFYI